LIEGQYPNYKQVIPESFKTRGVFSRDELEKIIKSSSLFAAGLNDINLKISASEGFLSVSSINSQTGEQKATIKGLVEGIDNEVTLNYRYLLDFMSAVQNPNTEVKLIDAYNPCVLVPKDSKDYLYVVMPIKR